MTTFNTTPGQFRIWAKVTNKVHYRPHQIERTPYVKDCWPHPALPIVRMAAEGFSDNRNQDGIVIEAGEPVAIWTDSKGRKWLVPAVGRTDVTVTYSQTDIDHFVEDLDNLGNPVVATGATTAKIPALIPIGVALHPVGRNHAYTDGILPMMEEDVFENYNPNLKPTIFARGSAKYPYIRHGVNAMGTLQDGERLAVGDINGATLSVTNRPHFVPLNTLTETAPVNRATTAIVFDTVIATNEFTITLADFSATFTCVATADDVTGPTDFILGATDTLTADAAVAAMKDVLPEQSYASILNAAGTITVTSAIYGTLGNIKVTDASATIVATPSNATTSATLRLEDVQIARVISVHQTLGEVGGKTGTMAPYGATAFQNLSGLDLSGDRDAGGVPADWRVKGNALGDSLPSDWTEAGFVDIQINAID